MAISFLSDLLAQNIPTQDKSESELMLEQVPESERLKLIGPSILKTSNTAVPNQLQESELNTGMSSEFTELLDRLIAMGIPREKILKILPFWKQFNKGGIVSLKHLTRPLKV